MKIIISKLICLVSIIYLVQCSNSVGETEQEYLFLEFKSGIKKSEFLAQAKDDRRLELINDGFPEYKYSIHLANQTYTTNLKPIFHLQSEEFYRVLIQGTVKTNKDLNELRDMFEKKYGSAPMTLDYSILSDFRKTPCQSWQKAIREVRFCTDSFPDHSQDIMSALMKKKSSENQPRKFIYHFAIDYIDKKIENQNLKEETVKEL
jgi:hypothetical protein